MFAGNTSAGQKGSVELRITSAGCIMYCAGEDIKAKSTCGSKCFFWRRGRDSNPCPVIRRLPHFECGPFDHLGTSPDAFFPWSAKHIIAEKELPVNENRGRMTRPRRCVSAAQSLLNFLRGSTQSRSARALPKPMVSFGGGASLGGAFLRASREARIS